MNQRQIIDKFSGTNPCNARWDFPSLPVVSSSDFWENQGILWGIYNFLPLHGNLCITYPLGLFPKPLQYLFRCLARGRRACPVSLAGSLELYRQCAYSVIFSPLFLGCFGLFNVWYQLLLPPGHAGRSCQMGRASPISLPFAEPGIRHLWWLFCAHLPEFCHSLVSGSQCWSSLWLCSDGLCPLPVTNTAHTPWKHSWEHIFPCLHGDKGWYSQLSGKEVLVSPWNSVTG